MVHTSSEAYCKEMLMLRMSFTVRLLQMARRVQSEGDNTCDRYFIFLVFFYIFLSIFSKVHEEKEIVCCPFYIS